MQAEKREKEPDSTFSFHLMKFAVQSFQKNTCELSSEEFDQVTHLAREEMLLHQLILNSDEACCVVVPEPNLKQTVHEVMAEYPDKARFYATLQENNLQFSDYLMALHNDLRVETVLARIASAVQPVTSMEIIRHYKKNKGDFVQPEQRSVAHIQIFSKTENSSGSDPALEKITHIHHRLQQRPETFSLEAKLHSECSTGKNGGKLGKLAAGELCPELDRAVFSLSPGDISPVIESTGGYHILKCREIQPEKHMSFGEAAPVISLSLLKKKQLQACRTWLQTLVGPVKGDKE